MRRCRVNGPGSIQVTIGLLGFTYFDDQGINICFQFFIREKAQGKRSAFDGFINICVVEGKSGAELA